MGTPPLHLLLRVPPSNWDGKCVSHKGYCPIAVQNIEPVGRRYQQKLVGTIATAAVEADSGKDQEDEEERKLRLSYFKAINLKDYYALLGLQETNFNSTEEQIRAAYKVMSLACHPDKAPLELRQNAEARFKAMKVAFETLVDPTRRRGYESTVEFDNAIPSADAGAGDDFFKVYGPVFARNARFSCTKPVPMLGDMNTSYDDVNDFYDFWFQFNSWRDFSHLDEHRLDDATSREEKRWMEKENAKKKTGEKRKEQARVRKLVDNAMAKDPRIAKRQKELEEEKLKKKQAIVAARQQKEAEELQAKQEQQAKEQAEQAAKAAIAEQEKKVKTNLKKKRLMLRKACGKQIVKYDLEEVDMVGTALSLEQLEALLLKFGATSPTSIADLSVEEQVVALAAFFQELNTIKPPSQADTDKQQATLAHLKVQPPPEVKAKPTPAPTPAKETKETKETKEAPQSGKRRRGKHGNAPAKAAEPAKPAEPVKPVEPVTPAPAAEQPPAKQKKEKKPKQPAQPATTEPAAAAAATQPAAATAAKGIKSLTQPAKSAEQKQAPVKAAAKAAPAKAKAKAPEAKAPETKQAAPAAAAAAPATATLKATPNPSWTVAQQAALDEALLSVPKDTPLRWEKIVTMVGGKTKAEIIARDKEMRTELFAAAKKQAEIDAAAAKKQAEADAAAAAVAAATAAKLAAKAPAVQPAKPAAQPVKAAAPVAASKPAWGVISAKPTQVATKPATDAKAAVKPQAQTQAKPQAKPQPKK